MKKLLLVCSAVLTFSSFVFAADKATQPLLSIIDDDTEFVVKTPRGPVAITRVMTSCAKNMGWLQAMVVDMRRHEDRIMGTIPGSVSIPYTEVVKQMEVFGCKKNRDSYDCKDAKKVYGFCNGPVCPQSPLAMTAMVKKGFPPEKIYYYRGGMLDWEALGLTIEVDKR